MLRQINKPVCLSVAERLAKQSGTGEAFNLHLRSANLDLSDAQLLANSLTSIQPQDDLQRSGAAVQSPENVNEFGMVGCQLGDDVIESLIRFMASSINLKMICMGDNLFSPLMRSQIALAGKKLAGCVTVV